MSQEVRNVIISMSQEVRNVIIIGSGPAGLTAAIYAARANLAPLCIEGFSAGGLIPGGQLMFTTDVENYPGFPEKVTGQELMTRFRDQALHQGCEMVTADVSKVDLSQRPFRVWIEGEDKPRLARSLILATGAKAKYLGLPSEEALKNRGVSACAVCDGALYRGKPVAVVGGGDTAMEEASYLSGLCSSVALIHRRGEFRASKAMQQRVLSNPKIKIYYHTVVEEVLDVNKGEVTGVRIRNLQTGHCEELSVAALFLAIGHQPMSDLVVGQLELHENGYIKTVPGSTRTSVEGVFAAGDVQDFTYRQAVTAAGTGCMAALEAERWLALQGSHLSFEVSSWIMKRSRKKSVPSLGRPGLSWSFIKASVRQDCPSMPPPRGLLGSTICSHCPRFLKLRLEKLQIRRRHHLPPSASLGFRRISPHSRQWSHRWSWWTLQPRPRPHRSSRRSRGKLPSSGPARSKRRLDPGRSD
ncbi:MAG: thioredoxin-disulfide reductase [Myxococcales bacterium]|nr:thioredoxin-disulfide reductase [Myxococcales bacterium]